MKKLLTILLVSIFLLSSISAWDWDNIKSYNEETKTITIKNALGLGETLAEIQLLTEQENRIIDLGDGFYQQVALLNFKEFKDYSNSIGKIKTYNLNNNNEEEKRIIKFKYKSIEIVSIPVYEKYNCKLIDGEDICENKIVGYEDRERTDWIEFKDLKELPDEKNLQIGLYADVKKGDRIEWIPEFFGKKVEEWAIWTEGGSALVHYYDFAENNGTIVDRVGGLNPASYNGQVGAIGGIIGGGYHGNGTQETDYVQFGDNTGVVQNKNFTIQVWFNTTNANIGDNDPIIAEGRTDQINDRWGILPATNGGDEVKFEYYTGTSYNAIGSTGSSLDDGGWHHVVVHTIDAGNGDTNATIWVDGIKGGSTNISSAFDVSSSVLFMFSATYTAGNDPYHGLGDEFGFWNVSLSEEDISSLYNAGVGLPYGQNAITVTLNTPENNTITQQSTQTFNCSVSTPSGTVQNLTLYIDGSPNETISDGVNDFLSLSTEKSLSEGTHTWNCKAYDITHNSNWYDFGLSNYTISIDNQAPQMNVTYPLGTIPYFVSGTNMSLNWTINDTNLDTCKFEYSGSNTTLDCGANVTSFNITSTNYKSGIVYANDTLGQSISQTIEWDYILFENDKSYNLISSEGNTENFEINLTKSSSYSISYANLIYNNTAYNSIYNLYGNNIIINKSITIPLITSQTNNTFYWNFITSEGISVNSTPNIQQIYLINLDDCSSYSNLIYNISMYDEETKNKITNETTMDISLNLYDTSNTNLISSYNRTFNNTNPATICLDRNISTNVNYHANLIIRYTANVSESNVSSSEYAIEYYNELNSLISNSTIPKDISLYSLKKSKSTDFQLTFRDSFLTLAPNILVYLYRQYIEDNDYKIVEVPLTDSNGQTILHMVRNDVLYNIVFVDSSGEVIASFNRITAFCDDYTIGSCSIRLNAPSTSSSLYNYEEDLGISYSNPTFNTNSDIVSLTYQSLNLSTITTSMEVIRSNAFGNRSVCKDSLTSPTGTLSCNVSSIRDTDRFVFVNIYVNGDLKITKTIDLEAEDSGFGVIDGAFYSFLLMLILIIMLSEDKQIMVIGVGIGWAIIIGFQLIKGNILSLGASAIWLFIIVGIFIWKLKKEDRIA